MTTLNINLQFSGGMELLFNNQKSIDVKIPSKFPDDTAESHSTNMRDVIAWTAKNLVQERPELFLGNDGSVRSGILVLVNDADWELEGELEYEVQDGDEIVFISTLHGG
ncbi:Ubiquitin- modifier 1 [Actinomortierella ambigua]|nr:Ubiquitin- modifier 1 [Actinomortierella ambigua]